MSENIGGSKKRKTLSAVLAISMVATMLLSGTLTYFYQSKAVNTFQAERKEVIGHDDFQEGENKDIYVENTGGTPVYVRVKLTEDFRLTDAAGNVNSYGTVDTPVAHHANSADVAVGNTADENEKKIHQYFTWTMGNKERKTVLSAKDAQFQAEAGTETEGVYLSNDENGKVAHDDLGKGVANGKPETLLSVEPCKVILMSEYNGYPETSDDPEVVTKKNYVGWVYDKNGWFYWSQMVQPGKATGFLLDNVTVKAGLDDYDYTYNLNVTYQAVDDRDIGLWTENKIQNANGEIVGQQEQASRWAAILLGMARDAAGQGMSQYARLRSKYNKAVAANMLGAQNIYGAAINVLDSQLRGYPEIDELEQMGDATVTAYETDPEINDVLITLDGDTTTGTVAAGSITTDNGLARLLVANFGENGKLTKGQAMGAVLLSVNGPAFKTSDFSALTAENFPHLRSIIFGVADLAVTQTQLNTLPADTTSHLEALWFNNATSYVDTTLDVTNFTKLVSLKMCAESVTEVQGLAGKDLKELRYTYSGMNTEIDVSGFPNLEILVLNEKIPSVAGLSGLKKLVYFEVQGDADGQSAIKSVDVSNAENLGCFNISNTSVASVTMPQKGFLTAGRIMAGGGFSYVNTGLYWIHNSGLKVVDISKFTNVAAVKLSIDGQTKPAPTVVIRRKDQPEFTDYPATEVIEKIIGGGENGEDLFLRHNGAAEPTAALESDFNHALLAATTPAV